MCLVPICSLASFLQHKKGEETEDSLRDKQKHPIWVDATRQSDSACLLSDVHQHVVIDIIRNCSTWRVDDI